LSERKNYWKKFEYQSKREFDILWMPQMMKLYTEPVQAASSISLDVLPEFSESMRNLIKEATQRGIRVYCKPYNRETVDLMRNLYDSIQSIGGKYFKSDVADSKGLTFALVNKANIVLWDQPGTGFLECLVSGIPTMVLWERIYCIEELWAKIDFKELKDLGIIHDNLDSFFLELEKFQKNKKAWINDVRRQQAILSFCKKYAHTDEGWCADWRKYLATKKKLQ
jgi:putative transferase (TIGR04331 family)